MRVLILGGTGAMGEHLVGLAAARGMEVHVTSRSRSGGSGSIQYIRGDAHNEAFLGDLLGKRWDVIVDFLVYGTTEFAERCVRLLNATGQYIYLSSARVYARSEGAITEDSPRLLDVSQDMTYLSTDEYALAKARQEDILRRSGKHNWTIVRPYITYARERLQLGVLEKEGWLYRALRGRSILFSSEIGERYTTMTSGADVARAMVALLGRSNALGEVFHVTSPRSYAWKEILEIYCDVLEEHLGARPKTVMVNLDVFLRCHPSKYQVYYDRMFNRRFDNQKISKFVDVASFVDARSGLQECLGLFLSRPTFKKIVWRPEAIKDRLAGEKTPFADISGVRSKASYLFSRYLKPNNIF